MFELVLFGSAQSSAIHITHLCTIVIISRTQDIPVSAAASYLFQALVMPQHIMFELVLFGSGIPS
jgi:hypothetical protein